jgi:nicotinamidase-related amidase
MKTQITDNTPLILIDMQVGFDDPFWGNRNNPDAEANVHSLLTLWRAKNRPVIHVKHCSLEQGSPLKKDSIGNEFKPEVMPVDDEIVFEKTVNSAFIGTGLEDHLKNNNFQTLVVVGLTTDHCVSTTTRMAGNLGFSPILVSDATATFDKTGPNGIHYKAEELHHIHLASLHNEFCEVCTTQSIVDLG